MTRSNRKKNHKRVKKLSKKLKDECCHAKKHYEEKINALEMELWNKQYHITSILGYLASISYNPWDRDVYRGFAKMCDGELKKLVFFHLCLHWVETSLESFLFAWTASWGHSIMTSKCSSCIADGGTFMDNGMTMFGRYHHELVVAQDYFE